MALSFNISETKYGIKNLTRYITVNSKVIIDKTIYYNIPLIKDPSSRKLIEKTEPCIIILFEHDMSQNIMTTS